MAGEKTQEDENLDAPANPADADRHANTAEQDKTAPVNREAMPGQGSRARGHPLLWSALLGAPFVAWGLYVSLQMSGVPPEIGLPILAFGLFIVGCGGYINFAAAPPPPTIREDERLIETRKPSQRAAGLKILSGFLFLIGSGYVLFYTFLPYIYFLVIGIIGLYLFSTGLYAYWTNTLTTYYVTNHRLIKEYRFISLVREELTFEKVRGVRERKSIWETLVGIGNVRVVSGGSGALEIVIRNISAPTGFADEIRNRL